MLDCASRTHQKARESIRQSYATASGISNSHKEHRAFQKVVWFGQFRKSPSPNRRLNPEVQLFCCPHFPAATRGWGAEQREDQASGTPCVVGGQQQSQQFSVVSSSGKLSAIVVVVVAAGENESAG